jgi:hypothetical protein
MGGSGAGGKQGRWQAQTVGQILTKGRAGDGRSSSDGINMPSPAGSADASKTPGKPQGVAISYTKI